MLRRTVDIVVGLHEAFVDEGVGLADGETFLLTVAGIESWVIALDHFVYGVGHIHVSPYAHLVCKYLIQANLQLITVCLYLTQVDCCRALTEVRGNES